MARLPKNSRKRSASLPARIIWNIVPAVRRTDSPDLNSSIRSG
jgi:hypothetical protein